MSYMRQPRQRPPLKNGVDMQLQTAFAEQNWTTVIRLADKRQKVAKDSYYECLKAVAESRLDGVADKAAVLVLVDQWVRGNVTPDLEAIELLEWACEESLLQHEYEQTYGTTFGVLRARWVVANKTSLTNPRSVAAATNCLRSCLQAWDLVNAQQIATVLDKSSSSKNDRRYMFWSILLTHLLAGDASQPPPKRNIYGMLAQKQLEKAAEAAEANGINTTEKPVGNDRSLRDEEEFLLYLRVLAAHGTADNYAQRALHPKAGAAVQLATAGRKQLLDEVLLQLRVDRRWDAVFELCEQALSLTTKDGAPSTLACDVRLWNLFILAAQQRDDVEAAFDTVQALLAKYMASPKLPLLYRKNIGLAVLQTTFSLPSSLVPETTTTSHESSVRVEQLLSYIEAHLDKASLFNDVRSFVERLPFEEATDLLKRLQEVASPESTTPNTLRHVLVFKLRYLLATCPETRCPRSVLYAQTAETQAEADSILLKGDTVRLFETACKVCRNAAPANEGCTTCLETIAAGALQLHRSLSDDSALLKDVLAKLGKDPRIDLSLVAASAFLRLDRLLSAALLLDAQHRQTPDDIPLRLLLVRLSLVLGCGSHALALWQPLGVKRSILDALGPLFYDRLSTAAPGLFAGAVGPRRGPLLEPVKQYFGIVLRHPSAVRIWDAFASGSYSSILDMAAYHTRLQQSATRVMAVVEERRAARALGGRTESVPDDILGGELYNATDYGALPNLESSFGPCLAERVSLGPGFSPFSPSGPSPATAGVVRLQLGVLAERFLDVVAFKPPKEYKPAKPAEAAARDRAYVAESLSILDESLHDLLHKTVDIQAQLTPAEWAYFTAVSALVGYAALALDSASTPSIFGVLTQSITTSVDLVKQAALSTASSSTSASALLASMSDLHSVGMLRETAVAIKSTVLFLTAHHDREATRDRSGKSGLSRDALAGLGQLKTVAIQTFAGIKAHLKAIKDALGQGGLSTKLKDEVREDELGKSLTKTVGADAVDDWVDHLIDGWRATLQGWTHVQMD
ncbi:hypothetical protein SBRCBS47491_000854 [Sporothrix bragantina]|uniref:Cytoskeleton organization protein n=1 Tax=Sporothrix bragantina TaxID=671064 RepID=A0ABP0ATT7_9PEZI